MQSLISRLVLLITMLISVGCAVDSASRDVGYSTVTMSEQVTVDLLRDRTYFRAPVSINGEEVGTFLVDTGEAETESAVPASPVSAPQNCPAGKTPAPRSAHPV